MLKTIPTPRCQDWMVILAFRLLAFPPFCGDCPGQFLLLTVTPMLAGPSYLGWRPNQRMPSGMEGDLLARMATRRDRHKPALLQGPIAGQEVSSCCPSRSAGLRTLGSHLTNKGHHIGRWVLLPPTPWAGSGQRPALPPQTTPDWQTNYPTCHHIPHRVK